MSELHEHTDKPLIAGAVIPVLPDSRILQSQREEETRGLVEALDAECAFVRTIQVRKPNPSVLLGSGQLDLIVEALEASECELLVVDGALTPIQQRNLEKRVGCKVIDRTGLILEIFGLRARTKAGRLQVETARLAYERSRLVRTWTHLERQRGGQGFISGPGETQIEADRRMIDNALQRLRKQLEDVEKTRRLQRSGRSARDIPIIALVGYTNAGKSTLFNRLTDANVFAKDMPFATLDPTIRQVQLTPDKQIAMVDTVGFITDLPTTLIESFKATLEETMDADLILHVHDAASPDVDDQAEDVERVLDELTEMFHVEAPPIVHVWNKCDLMEAFETEARQEAIDGSDSPEHHVLVSAVTGEGIDCLKSLIADLAFDEAFVVDLEIAPEHGEMAAWLHRNGRVTAHDVHPDSGNILMTVVLSEKNLNRLEKRFADILETGVDASIEKKLA